MNITDWTPIIVALLGGGLFGTIFAYLLGNRKQNKDEFVVLISTYKAMVEDLKTEFRDERDKMQMLLDSHAAELSKLNMLIHQRDKEINDLRNQLMIFESSHNNVPVPIWLKDTSGKILFINKEYEEKILNPINKTADDYLYHYDIDVWGPEICKTFLQNDKKVMKSKQAEEVIEEWTGPNGIMMVGRVIKYPRFAGRDTVIGIGGIIVQMWVKGEL